MKAGDRVQVRRTGKKATVVSTIPSGVLIQFDGWSRTRGDTRGSVYGGRLYAIRELALIPPGEKDPKP